MSSQIAALLAALLIAAPIAAAPLTGGAGDLLVAPTRLVLEGPRRSAAVTLRNTGTKAALYRITFEDLRMDERGRVSPVVPPTPADNPAAALLRYSPRQVMLEPGETQVVRVVVRKPADLPDGEYRSHLTFKAVPETLTHAHEEEASSATAWSVRLVPVYGVSIPVIVRHGVTESSVEVSEARWLPPSAGQPARVHVRLERAGNASAYGDVTVLMRGPKGAEIPVGRARGVAVWTPNTSRIIEVPLTDPRAIERGSTQLVVRHTSADGTELSRRAVAR